MRYQVRFQVRAVADRAVFDQWRDEAAHGAIKDAFRLACETAWDRGDVLLCTGRFAGGSSCGCARLRRASASYRRVGGTDADTYPSRVPGVTGPSRGAVLRTRRCWNGSARDHAAQTARCGCTRRDTRVRDALIAERAGGADSYRDVDVRLMLDDDEFAQACPTRARWELLCLAVSAYLRERTGLPVDFQVQLTSIANEKYGGKARNPLGMGRIFAGGGDATPEWEHA